MSEQENGKPVERLLTINYGPVIGANGEAGEGFVEHRELSARYTTGVKTVQVPPATSRVIGINQDGEPVERMIPGAAEIELGAGPPVFVFVQATGPVECQPFGQVEAGEPFVYGGLHDRDRICTGGVRRVVAINDGPKPVTVAVEVLYDTTAEEGPKRERRAAQPA